MLSKSKSDGDVKGSDPSRSIKCVCCIFFVLINWSLVAIACGEKCDVSEKMVDKIYKDNGIEKEKIGKEFYKREDVTFMLTSNYLKS